MIEHSALSRRLPRELWLLAHGIDPDRERFFKSMVARGEEKPSAYYDYVKKVRDLRRNGMGQNAAIEIAAKHFGVSSRTVRRACRYEKQLRADKSDK